MVPELARWLRNQPARFAHLLVGGVLICFELAHHLLMAVDDFRYRFAHSLGMSDERSSKKVNYRQRHGRG
jgi:hypothetical protein